MGRRKISIQPITDERNRKVTFVKRKAGLFKKAHELAVLCQVDLAVIILGNNNNKFYEYTSVDTDQLLVRYRDRDFTHDTKTPADYGEYQMESRVQTATLAHKRTASSVSFSVEENDNSSDDDEEEEEEEEEEPPAKPAPKRRRAPARATRAKEESKRSSSEAAPAQLPAPTQTPPHPAQEQGPKQHQVQYHQSPFAPQMQQQQHHQQHQHQHHQLPQPQSWGHPPQNPNLETVQPTQGNYTPYQMQSVPQQYQFPVPGNFANSPMVVMHPPNMPPQQQQQQQQLQQHQQHQQQQQQQQQSGQQQLPSVVPNSQGPHSSPFMNSRARSLNNNISTRPILRVEIPSDPTRPTQGTKPGDSALTMTAIDTSKQPDNTDKSSVSKQTGDKTPPSAKSNEDIKPSALGILSNNSTPVSATLPSALFNLPPPQAMPHYHGPNNNGNFKPLVAGEQTPLTAGLPSRYVPDLFPSPSNFYSNEWNIPFGSGNTPYPSSAGPHMLPLPGGSNPGANAKIRKHTMLNNDAVDSPLQNLQKDVKDSRATTMEELEARKIKFEQMRRQSEEDKR